MPTDDFTRELDDAVREVRMDEKYSLEYVKWQIRDRENQQIGYEIGHSEGYSEGLAERDNMLAEKDAIIES